MTPWTVAHQVPLSMRLPRQEYRSGLPFLRDLPDPGIEPMSPALKADSLPLKPWLSFTHCYRLHWQYEREKFIIEVYKLIFWRKNLDSLTFTLYFLHPFIGNNSVIMAFLAWIFFLGVSISWEIENSFLPNFKLKKLTCELFLVGMSSWNSWGYSEISQYHEI